MNKLDVCIDCGKQSCQCRQAYGRRLKRSTCSAPAGLMSRQCRVCEFTATIDSEAAWEILSDMATGAVLERAAVIRWLRSLGPGDFSAVADRLEAGEHL